MALADCKRNMEMCCRCSCCKFIPLERVEGYRYAYVCPSIARYNFHAYSGGGRIGMAVGMLEHRFEYSDTFLKVLYDCQMCGGCDVSCKYAMDMDVLDPINEMRITCVGSGRSLPVLDRLRDNLRAKGVMVGPPPKTDGPRVWMYRTSRRRRRRSFTTPAAGRAPIRSSGTWRGRRLPS